MKTSAFVSDNRLALLCDGVEGDAYLVSLGSKAVTVASVTDGGELHVGRDVPVIVFDPRRIHEALGSDWNWDELSEVAARHANECREWTKAGAEARFRGFLGAR